MESQSCRIQELEKENTELKQQVSKLQHELQRVRVAFVSASNKATESLIRLEKAQMMQQAAESKQEIASTIVEQPKEKEEQETVPSSLEQETKTVTVETTNTEKQQQQDYEHVAVTEPKQSKMKMEDALLNVLKKTMMMKIKIEIKRKKRNLTSCVLHKKNLSRHASSFHLLLNVARIKKHLLKKSKPKSKFMNHNSVKVSRWL
jgi:hypothetical protein